MLKFTRDSFVDDELYDSRIKRNGFVWVNKRKMSLIQKYLTTHADTLRVLAHSYMNLDSGGRYIDMSRQSVIHYLTDHVGIPKDRLKSGKTAGASLNYKDVLKPLIESDTWGSQFLEWYSDYTSNETKAGRGKNLVAGLTVTEEKDFLGETLSKLRYSVEVEENLRYYYNNEDLISIPREYKASFGVKKGYVLVWGDIAQSDFRIAYNLLLRDEFNSEIMDSCEDKYEGIARVLSKFYEEDFDLAQFKEERELYKVNVLETIFGNRRGTTRRDNQFIRRFAGYLETCPRYQAYIQSIENRYETGLHALVTGFFGFTQPNSGINLQKFTNKCLNTPIQTGTSQLMILLVNTILDKFYSLGYTEEDVNVYMIRHDEPIFQMKEEALKDSWVFEECSKIIVENWIPIDIKFSYGRYYSEEDPLLTKEAEMSIRDNRFNITKVEADESAKPYHPIPKTLILNAMAEEVGDQIIFSFYNKENHTVKYFNTDEVPREEWPQLFVREIAKNVTKIKQEGYSAVVIFTDVGKFDIHTEGMYINVKNSSNKGNAYAQVLTHFMSAKYAKKYKYLHQTDMDLLNTNKGMIESVGEFDVF